jgi:phospholipid transport system transporter-binding protein
MAERETTSSRLVDHGDGHFALSGVLGFQTAAMLLARGIDCFASHQRVELDLGAVTATDSAGLALLLEWTRQSRRAGHTIVFKGMPARLQAIARISGVEQFLPGEVC